MRRRRAGRPPGDPTLLPHFIYNRSKTGSSRERIGTEEPSITWQRSHFPSAAPAVACGVHQELQELDMVADGAGWRAVAAGGTCSVLEWLSWAWEETC